MEPVLQCLLEPGQQVNRLRFSPCGRLLAGTTLEGTVLRWDLGAPPVPDAAAAKALAQNPKAKVPEPSAPPSLPFVGGHRGFATGLAFHPFRDLAFSADSWGSLRAWPCLALEPRPLWEVPAAHDGWIRDLAMGAGGDWLVTGGRDGKVRIHDSATGGLLRELALPDGSEIFAVAAHPIEPWVVAGGLFGRIALWNALDGRLVREFDGSVFHLLHRLQDIGGLRCLGFADAGRTLFASGTKPKGGGNVNGHARLCLFDTASGALRHEMEVGELDKDIFAHEAAAAPGGLFLVPTTGQPGSGNFFGLRPGEPEPVFKFNKGTVNCHSVALSPDGLRCAVAATNTGSNGNGRRLVDGKYPGNYSPVHLFRLG